MKKYRKIIIFSIIVIYPIYITCQNQNIIINHKIEQFRIETPNEASFNKYIDNPIDIYSGTPDISIPVYNLIDGKIEQPIVLRYNSSGIKVNEEASWVGLGWNLNVGGVITRSVIGGIDRYITTNAIDRHKDIMQNRMKADLVKIESIVDNIWSEDVRNAFDYEFKMNVESGVGFNEGRFNPDVFYYSAPGISGRFIIDFFKEKAVILDRNDNTQIELLLKRAGEGVQGQMMNNKSELLTGFKIITPNGIIHEFNYFSTMEQRERSSYTTETFLLTKTIYPNDQIVTYSYDSIVIYKYNHSESVKTNFPGSISKLPYDGLIGSPTNQFGLNGVEDQTFNPYSISSTNQAAGKEFIINKIETNNYYIKFDCSNREDLPDLKKLDKIKIYTKKGDFLKEFNFSYYYTYSSAKESDYWSKENGSSVQNYIKEEHFRKRLILNSLETSVNNKKMTSIHFIIIKHNYQGKIRIQ